MLMTHCVHWYLVLLSRHYFPLHCTESKPGDESSFSHFAGFSGTLENTGESSVILFVQPFVYGSCFHNILCVHPFIDAYSKRLFNPYPSFTGYTIPGVSHHTVLFRESRKYWIVFCDIILSACVGPFSIQKTIRSLAIIHRMKGLLAESIYI